MKVAVWFVMHDNKSLSQDMTMQFRYVFTVWIKDWLPTVLGEWPVINRMTHPIYRNVEQPYIWSTTAEWFYGSIPRSLKMFNWYLMDHTCTLPYIKPQINKRTFTISMCFICVFVCMFWFLFVDLCICSIVKYLIKKSSVSVLLLT